MLLMNLCLSSYLLCLAKEASQNDLHFDNRSSWRSQAWPVAAVNTRIYIKGSSGLEFYFCFQRLTSVCAELMTILLTNEARGALGNSWCFNKHRLFQEHEPCHWREFPLASQVMEVCQMGIWTGITVRMTAVLSSGACRVEGDKLVDGAPLSLATLPRPSLRIKTGQSSACWWVLSILYSLHFAFSCWSVQHWVMNNGRLKEMLADVSDLLRVGIKSCIQTGNLHTRLENNVFNTTTIVESIELQVCAVACSVGQCAKVVAGWTSYRCKIILISFSATIHLPQAECTRLVRLSHSCLVVSLLSLTESRNHSVLQGRPQNVFQRGPARRWELRQLLGGEWESGSRIRTHARTRI